MDKTVKNIKIAIIGAGRTGRGFIARLLQNQAQIIFFDINKTLIEKLRSQGEFNVNYYDSDKTDKINGYAAYTTESPDCGVVLGECDCVFVSVGGENTANAGEWLEKYICPDIRVIACENAVCPADLFGESLRNRACSGAVFCTTTEADKDGGLDIMSEDYPVLYTDSNIPDFIAGLNGIEPVKDFATLMKRKIYTYNAASAIIAYIGAKKGYELYSDAANDKEIEEMLDCFYNEINKAICEEYSINHEEQRKFAMLSKKKFQNVSIIDSVSRNAASPLRKLSPSERIIEPARLILRYGGSVDVLIKTAVAAINYAGIYDKTGITGILTDTCGLSENEKLFELIMKEGYNHESCNNRGAG